MKAVELTNGVVYFSSQTNFLEYNWANHVNCLWSGKIDYHSFPDGGFMSLGTELCFEHIESFSYCIISEDFYMPLFGRFPFLDTAL